MGRPTPTVSRPNLLSTYSFSLQDQMLRALPVEVLTEAGRAIPTRDPSVDESQAGLHGAPPPARGGI